MTNESNVLRGDLVDAPLPPGAHPLRGYWIVFVVAMSYLAAVEMLARPQLAPQSPASVTAVARDERFGADNPHAVMKRNSPSTKENEKIQRGMP